MGNLRPAPAELTPMRVDSLMRALDQFDGLAELRAFGLTEADIASIRQIARHRGTSSLETAQTLLRAALEAVAGAR
jgi:hypothetical protein